MILGIGTDLISIKRIEDMLEKQGERFIKKYFSDAEVLKAESFTVGKANVYAKRWAAKEAFAKALGLGFRGNISMKDISIVNDDNGKPSMIVYGGAKEELDKMIPNGMKMNINLSMSDDTTMAMAFVILSAEME